MNGRLDVFPVEGHLEGNACRESSREAMGGLLRRLAPGTRLLVSGFNDPSSVGALQAVREEGRQTDVVIVGQNATLEGRNAIREKNSPLIASVAYFPERYGEKLLPLAMALARGEPVPPAVYTEHRILDASNVDRLYPAGYSSRILLEAATKSETIPAERNPPLIKDDQSSE